MIRCSFPCHTTRAEKDGTDALGAPMRKAFKTALPERNQSRWTSTFSLKAKLVSSGTKARMQPGRLATSMGLGNLTELRVDANQDTAVAMLVLDRITSSVILRNNESEGRGWSPSLLFGLHSADSADRLESHSGWSDLDQRARILLPH